MEHFTFRLGDKKRTLKEFKIVSMSIIGGRLSITFAEDYSSIINVGDNLTFHRLFDVTKSVISRDVTILNIIDGKNIITTIPYRTNSLNVSDSLINKNDWTEQTGKVVMFNRDIQLYSSDIKDILDDNMSNSCVVEFRRPDSTRVIKIENPIIPDDVTNNRMILRGITDEEYDFINNNICYVNISTNEFYFTQKNDVCKLYNNVVLTKFIDTINLNLGFSEEVDHVGLMREEVINNIFDNEYLDNIVPPIIDYEKVRFVPCIKEDVKYKYSGGIGIRSEFEECENIILKFHFRTRNNEGWSIKGDAEYQWNQELNEEDNVSTSKQYYTSDLLGLLGFTDDDIHFQKNCIKKSFIRLLFYTSKDPLDQKLIAYSTVFLDSNELLKKYLKLVKNGVKSKPFVMYSGCTYEDRLTSEVSISSMFNHEKSSEGFYLYIFKSDAPKENERKTIYMKVEFNHAKYGRTIPMLVWPHSDGNVGKYLTPGNYHDSVYIPVTLRYTNGRYVYYFGDEFNNEKNIVFSLFEPRLTIQESRD